MHPSGIVGAVLRPWRRRRRHGARRRLRRRRVRRQHRVGAASAAAHAARLAPLALTLLPVPRVDQQMERWLRPVPRPPPIAAALVHLRGRGSPVDQVGGFIVRIRVDRDAWR